MLDVEKKSSDLNRQTLTIELNQFNKVQPPDASVVRVVQITDCHLGEQVGEKLAGMDTDASLDYVLELIRKEECLAAERAPHLLIATGDLSNHGAAEAYSRLHQKLNMLPIPSAWIPGNHDLRDLMIDTVGIALLPRIVRVGNWALCMLDSTVPGQVSGELGEAEIQALQLMLQAIPSDCHIMLCFHHQPVPVGSNWLDEQQLADSNVLFETLVNEDRLRAIVWGHVHQDFCTRDTRLPNVDLIASPSTCVQFAPNTASFKLDDNQPGYRWFNLHNDGRVETGVSRVDGSGLTMDLASNGY